MLAQALDAVLDDEASTDLEAATVTVEAEAAEVEVDDTEIPAEMALGLLAPVSTEIAEPLIDGAARVDGQVPSVDAIAAAGSQVAEVSAMGADQAVEVPNVGTQDVELIGTGATNEAIVRPSVDGPTGEQPARSLPAEGADVEIDAASGADARGPAGIDDTPSGGDPTEPDSIDAVASRPRPEAPTPLSDDLGFRPTAIRSSAATNAAAEVSQPAADPSMLDGDDPWSQLATVIKPLRQLPDGTHRLSLQLRPAELGAVHLEVAVEDGQLSVRAMAESISSRDVLASAMPELREELVRSGIDVGSLDVGEHTSDGATSGGGDLSDPTPWAPGGGEARPAAEASAAPAATPDPAPTSAGAPGHLDLNL